MKWDISIVIATNETNDNSLNVTQNCSKRIELFLFFFNLSFHNIRLGRSLVNGWYFLYPLLGRLGKIKVWDKAHSFSSALSLIRPLDGFISTLVCAIEYKGDLLLILYLYLNVWLIWTKSQIFSRMSLLMYNVKMDKKYEHHVRENKSRKQAFDFYACVKMLGKDVRFSSADTFHCPWTCSYGRLCSCVSFA